MLCLYRDFGKGVTPGKVALAATGGFGAEPARRFFPLIAILFAMGDAHRVFLKQVRIS
jgi:hypothetical protein